MQNPAQPGRDILRGFIITAQLSKNKEISHPFTVEKDVALAMKRYKRLNWPFKILDVLVCQILMLYRFMLATLRSSHVRSANRNIVP